MKALNQFLALPVLDFDQSMWNVIFIEKIVEQTAIAIIAQGKDAKAGKLAVASKTSSPHDQRIDNQGADSRQFGESATKFVRRNMQNLGRIRGDAGSGQRRGALQHGDVAEKIALATGGEKLFCSVALFEYLNLAA